MSDPTRVGGSSNPPSQVTDTPNVDSATASNTFTHGAPMADTGTTIRTSGALKQRGNEAKSHQNISGNLMRSQLQAKLEKSEGPITSLSKEATPQQLNKIHVQREKTKDDTTTHYPNGVTIHRTEGHSTDGKNVRIDPSHSVESPPGGKFVQTSDNEMKVIDAKGKEVGTVTQDDDGTVHVRTKEGDYTDRPNGSITFARN